MAEPRHDRTVRPRPELRVVHPLDDFAEPKRFLPDDTGRMEMSRTVKWALGALRAYLVLITVLVAIRVVQLASAHS
jgi:hypothetical protein